MDRNTLGHAKTLCQVYCPRRQLGTGSQGRDMVDVSDPRDGAVSRAKRRRQGHGFFHILTNAIGAQPAGIMRLHGEDRPAQQHARLGVARCGFEGMDQIWQIFELCFGGA